MTSFESLRQLTAIVRSWLRDVLAVCAGTPEPVSYTHLDVYKRQGLAGKGSRIPAIL